KSASAERCLRALGATMAMGNPITRTSHRSSPGVFSHQCLRKASAADTVITGLGGSAGIADIYWAVGRLHFDDQAGYRSYAESVVAYEKAVELSNARSVAIFSTNHDFDR